MSVFGRKMEKLLLVKKHKIRICKVCVKSCLFQCTLGVAAVSVSGEEPTPPDVGLMSQSRHSLPVAVWLEN